MPHQKPAQKARPRARRAAHLSLCLLLALTLGALDIQAQSAEKMPSPPEAKIVAEEKASDRAAELRAELKSAKTDAERARIKRALIDYLIAQNRKTEALEELRASLREERFDPSGFYNTGNALARLGDANAAIEAYRKAIEQRKGNYARAHNNLGVVLLRLGRWDEAYDAFITALRLESFRYAEASYNLGRLYTARGETDLAIREWRRTLLLDPAHRDAAAALARVLVSDGQTEQALAVLDGYTKRNGADEAIEAARRNLNASAGVAVKPAASAGYTKTAVTGTKGEGRAAPLAPGNTSPAAAPLALDQDTYELLQHARAAREAGRDEEAVRYYGRALARRQGYFPPANMEQSYALINLNRFDEAMANLKLVATRDGSRYPIAYYHLARLYERRAEWRLAGEAYSRAAAAYGDENPQFLLDVSRVREKEGDYKGALAAMESYIETTTRLGRSPDWSQSRLAEMRQKAAGKK